MKGSRFIVLAAALAAAGAAVWLSNVGRDDGEAKQALFPGLTLEVLNSAEQIGITAPGGGAVTLRVAGDGVWRVAEYHDYPADTVKIRQLLSDLQDAKKIEQKTSSPEHYAVLGVVDPETGMEANMEAGEEASMEMEAEMEMEVGEKPNSGEADSEMEAGEETDDEEAGSETDGEAGEEVDGEADEEAGEEADKKAGRQIKEGAGKLLAFKAAGETRKLIVGKPSRQVSSGVYVRKPDEDESWLINIRLQLPADPAGWLDKEIVHIEPNDVSTMTLSHPDDDEAFTIARGADGQLKIRDLPPGRTLKNQPQLKRIASVTDYLQFKNVFPREDNGISLPDAHITAAMATLDGLTLTITAYKTEENDAYFTLDVDGTSTRAVELGQHLPKWLYGISSTIYDNLDVRLEDLLEEAS